MAEQSHYPFYNVMEEQDHWDDHTQKIVQSRLSVEITYAFLTTEEALAVTAICALLLDDNRFDVLNFVVSHIDSSLTSTIGEGQRGAKVPEARALVRDGLYALHQHAILAHQTNFASLHKNVQLSILEKLSSNLLQPAEHWSIVPQKAFFNKLHGWAVEAYCSHPTIWSEIGYAGPAYPRGYTRMDIGELDPWEAKPQR